MKTAEHLSFTEYAKRRGVTQPYVSQLVAKGVIPLTADRKIDPEAADAAIAATRDLSKQGVAARHAAARAAKSAAPAAPAQAAPSAPASEPVALGQYQKAKTANEVFRAKSAQLEYERAVGKLVERDRYDRAIADAMGPLLAKLDGLGARLGPKLLGITDVRRAIALAEDEVRDVRQEIADTLSAMATSGGATKQ